MVQTQCLLIGYRRWGNEWEQFVYDVKREGTEEKKRVECRVSSTRLHVTDME